MGGPAEYDEESAGHRYRGYDHRNSWGAPGDQSEERASEWSQCADKCFEKAADCQGWTFSYGKDGGTPACYLKRTLANLLPTKWTSGDCYAISGCGDIQRNENGYTAYDHRNSEGEHGHQTPETANSWSECADKCSNSQDCQGWTFLYESSGANCFLKRNLQQNPDQWLRGDCYAISGLKEWVRPLLLA